MADTLNLEAERAAFEKASNDARFFPRELDFTTQKSPSGKRDEYVNRSLQASWEGWLLARRSTSSVSEGQMPECLRCEGRGNYAVMDDAAGRVVNDKCRECGGSGRATKAAAPAETEYDRTIKLMTDPPYGQPDLYARLHVALTQQIEGARQAGKLTEWFSAAAGLVEYLAGKEGIPAPAEDAREEVQDERALFEAWARTACNMPENVKVNWDALWTKQAWEGWEARARRATSVPAIPGAATIHKPNEPE